jgi:hypothetical protein
VDRRRGDEGWNMERGWAPQMSLFTLHGEGIMVRGSIFGFFFQHVQICVVSRGRHESKHCNKLFIILINGHKKIGFNGTIWYHGSVPITIKELERERLEYHQMSLSFLSRKFCGQIYKMKKKLICMSSFL